MRSKRGGTKVYSGEEATLDEVAERLVGAWIGVKGPLTLSWNRKIVREGLEAGVKVVARERARDAVVGMVRRAPARTGPWKEGRERE